MNDGSRIPVEAIAAIDPCDVSGLYNYALLKMIASGTSSSGMHHEYFNLSAFGGRKHLFRALCVDLNLADSFFFSLGSVPDPDRQPAIAEQFVLAVSNDLLDIGSLEARGVAACFLMSLVATGVLPQSCIKDHVLVILSDEATAEAMLRAVRLIASQDCFALKPDTAADALKRIALHAKNTASHENPDYCLALAQLLHTLEEEA